ncbi:hypothetical protein BH24ACT12_BH24ACT12_25700 [soil metagenome]
MSGYVITIGTGREHNWDLARRNQIWAMRANYGIRAGDDLFFWQAGGVGLIAHARATTDGTPVTRRDRLPWPDHQDKPYQWKFGIQVLSEPPSAVETRWRVIQRLLGTGAIASNAASRIEVEHRLQGFIALFDPAHDSLAAAHAAVDDERQQLGSVEDARTFDLRAVARRQGQPAFRRKLLAAYNHACCITGYDGEPALEAAHISPYRGSHTNVASNGLLLRADIHTLFDLHLVTIRADDYTLRVAESLRAGTYASLHHVDMREPRSAEAMPNLSALADHNAAFDARAG